MFEKLPSGYRPTAAGQDVVGLAEQMKTAATQLEARVFGRDENVRGLLRVTMAPMLASHLLMPDFAEFARLHPEIEVNIHSSDDLVNLTNRQADVALRVISDRSSLPLNLQGLKGPEIYSGVYVSRRLLAVWRAGNSPPIRWVVKEFDGIPTWGQEGDIPVAEIRSARWMPAPISPRSGTEWG